MAPPLPTRSSSSAPPLSSLSSQSASIPSTQDVIPVNTVSSACCSSTPNIVVLDLHTTIVIPNYSLFYSTPIASFLPDYRALADGSLVAPPLISDIESANVHLALMSALAMFFIITTLTSIRYIRRGKFKKKILFYILFASQLLGLVSIVALIIPFFNSFVSCTAIGFVVILGTLLSYSLLVSGVSHPDVCIGTENLADDRYSGDEGLQVS
ncbi:hypothetical protein PHLCEN_2v5333 [Hermanssonia centrifuga]|uniref:Uncharacterized protein n=1 Tax=Hermanssonia centrifuga TaxID=98765 RepID=A0A2R6P5J5_9APHY|nr:hypothetical protein PHLCEN_2v5333 [Hermanssonia centrifuga]